MGDPSPPLQQRVWRPLRNYAIGSLAGSTSITIFAPFDTLKTRMQITSGRGPAQVVRELVQTEGVRGLYAGLSAGVGRQFIYAGTRLGLFDAFQDKLRAGDPSRTLPFWQNAGAALVAGGMAAVVGNPMDVSLIRMQADATLPAAERRGYRHVGHAVVTIFRTEGVAGLFAGVGPTVVRAMAANFGSLTFNAEAKVWLSRAGVTGDSQILASGVVGGVASSVFGMPFDYVKTQMQKQKPDVRTGAMPYKSAFTCVQLTFRDYGIFRFYRGYPIYLLRIAPFQALALIIRDKLKQVL